jgi:hypothetical protein
MNGSVLLKIHLHTANLAINDLKNCLKTLQHGAVFLLCAVVFSGGHAPFVMTLIHFKSTSQIKATNKTALMPSLRIIN